MHRNHDEFINATCKTHGKSQHRIDASEKSAAAQNYCYCEAWTTTVCNGSTILLQTDSSKSHSIAWRMDTTERLGAPNATR
mmetsp:Transcript_99395/g.157241  ORF Transcript_99395/g.157241 Transcript_99395/m.157241 type:complete len:81 (+) Transcript_99395:38-280(+)